jgi:hypothetical protein
LETIISYKSFRNNTFIKEKKMRWIAFLLPFSLLISNIICIPTTVSAAPYEIKWSIHRDVIGDNPSTSGIVAADVISNGLGPAGKPILELFIAGQNYIACLRGSDGALQWKYIYPNSNPDHHVMQGIDDIDNDSVMELLVVNLTALYCINAATGALKWIYQVPIYPGWSTHPRIDKHFAVVDCDHTGDKYIFAACEGYGTTGQKTTLKINCTGTLVTSRNIAYTCWGGLSAADLEGDGNIEIIQNHRPSAGVICFDTELNTKWQVTGIPCSSHPPSIADVNHDGTLDVIVGYQGGTDARGLWVIDGSTGQKMPGKCQNSIPGLNVWNDMAIYDVDQDGNLEVISSYQDSETNNNPNNATVFDLTIWQMEATLPHPIHQSPSIGNVDADPDMEIICTSGSGAGSQGMTIFKYVDGNYNPIFQIWDQQWGGYGDTVVIDIDGDGYNEIFTPRGGIYAVVCIETNGVASVPGPRASTSLSNERRTKVSEYIPPPGEESETPKTIQVIAPNGGETWTLGSNQTILWSYTGDINNVKIELYKGGTYDSTISASTINNGSFSWTITQNTGTTYKIKITDTANNTVWAESNNSFSIVEIPKTITVVTPNGGETWTKGSTHTISWSYTGDINNVKIELYKNGTYDSAINTSTINNGSYPWNITQNTGTTYKIKITDTFNNTVWGESNTYFSIIDSSFPPNAPTINGPAGGKTNIQYNYTINAVDPDKDNVYYYIDWGDTINSGWVGPFPSGADVIINHTWTIQGTYVITGKAKDVNDLESPSTTLDVTMPRDISSNTFFFWFFNLFPHAFPILQYLLGY